MASLDETLAKASEQLIGAVEKYGPNAVDFAKEVGRIAAAQQIVTGIAFAVAAGTAYWCWARPMTAKVRSQLKAGSGDFMMDCDPFVCIFGLGFGWLVTTVLIGCTLSNLTDVFAWVGISHPEIYLAAKMLKLAH